MYCVICERESQSSSAWCENCGYSLTGAVTFCAQCCRKTDLTSEGQCVECGAQIARVAATEQAERAVEWSYTAIPTMAGRCYSCGCEVSEERSFCPDCEAEINTAIDETFAARQARAQGIAPDRKTFFRRAASLLALLPLALILFWLGKGADRDSRPHSALPKSEAGIIGAAAVAPPPKASRPSVTERAARPEATSADVSVRKKDKAPAVNRTAIASARMATRRIEQKASRPSNWQSRVQTFASPAARPAPTPNALRNPAPTPAVHSRPRRVFQTDPQGAAQKSKGTIQPRSGEKLSQTQKPAEPSRSRWPVRLIKGIGKKTAAIFR
jgi:hypothetical protein